MKDIDEHIECWTKVLSSLGVEIVEISTQEIGIKTNYETLPLLKNFGGKRGMLLFPDGSKVLVHHETLSEKGYGYSVIKCPVSEDGIVKKEVISLLKDWTWTGLQYEEPAWLKDEKNETKKQ